MSAVGGVTAVVAGGVAVTTTWASRTTPERLWRRRILPDLGSGPLAVAAAVAAWDFLYYWDHRFMHTSRYMWAIHVVHHSSEHYNLSTALRQPVAEAFGTFVPFGSLCLFGIRPGLVETARGVNLLYQYWIHTETVGALGPRRGGPQHPVAPSRAPRFEPRSTSTATTAASSSCGTSCSAPSSPRATGSSTA